MRSKAGPYRYALFSLMVAAAAEAKPANPAPPLPPPAGTIVNESSNGLHNKKGTVAMARLQDPNSASSQFFINVADNDNLDSRPGKPGYAVFARVTAGMDVVDRIADVATGDADGMSNVPTEPVVILSARRLP